MGDPSHRGINPSQVVQDGLEKRIAFAELVRVFGEPKNSPASMGAARIDATTAPEAQTNELQAIREELMEELRDRARNAEERAKRYEDELSDLRKRNDELTARLLPPPMKPGLFARWFGK